MDDLHNLIQQQQQQQTWQLWLVDWNGNFAWALCFGHGFKSRHPQLIPTRSPLDSHNTPTSLLHQSWDLMMMIPHYIHTYIHTNDI